MHIAIYSTPTCPYCKMAKQFFTEHAIAFDDIDVSADEKRAEEMIRMSGQMGVPVIVVTTEAGKEEVVIGFDKAKLATLVGVRA